MTAPPLVLPFDNRFVAALPADPIAENRRRQVFGAAYSRVRPTPVTSPQVAAYAWEVAESLGMSAADCETEVFAEVFGGNRLLEGMDPYACCYGGHQFGNWARQLSDGRAISLGEVVGPAKRLEIQLKGAGPTPYSRRDDGRAVMRSSVREFLCSEAMHHLGVPTTRALSLVATGEKVMRDMFYDGHPAHEPGAIVCRVAPTFIRFGSFEIFAIRRENEALKALAEHTLRQHFPHLGAPSPEVYGRWLEEVSNRTAEMIVQWLRVGFVHGVMNTDNMSILGLTIDYGPYGWLDNFDPQWTPNTTDAQSRRYRFGHQASIAWWNLAQFANAIYPLVGDADLLQAALDTYPRVFETRHDEMMAAKLGLEAHTGEDDTALVNDLIVLMAQVETDMTLFYRRLADVPAACPVSDLPADLDLLAPLMDAYYSPEALPTDYVQQMAAWLRRYVQRVQVDGAPDAVRAARMNAVNPKYVLRNYVAQLAIDKAEEGDYSVVTTLLDVMRRPYDEQPEHGIYAEKRPEWARHRPGCSMLSCSS